MDTDQSEAGASEEVERTSPDASAASDTPQMPGAAAHPDAQQPSLATHQVSSDAQLAAFGQAIASARVQSPVQTQHSDRIESSAGHRPVLEIRTDPSIPSSSTSSSAQAPADAAYTEPTVLPATYECGLGAVICTPTDHNKSINTVRYQEVRQMLGPYPGGLSADIPLATALGLPLRFKQPTVYSDQDLGDNSEDPLQHARVIHANGDVKKPGKYDDIRNEIIADLGVVVDPAHKLFGCQNMRQSVFTARKGQIMFWRADDLDLYPEHLDALMDYLKFYLRPLCRKIHKARYKTPEIRWALRQQLLAKLTPEAFAEAFEAIRKWRIRTGDDLCDWMAAENPVTGEYWGPREEDEEEVDLMERGPNEPDFEAGDDQSAVEGASPLLRKAVRRVAQREQSSQTRTKTIKDTANTSRTATPPSEAVHTPADSAEASGSETAQRPCATATSWPPQIGTKRSRSRSKEGRARKSRMGERVWDAAMQEGGNPFGLDPEDAMDQEQRRQLSQVLGKLADD